MNPRAIPLALAVIFMAHTGAQAFGEQACGTDMAGMPTTCKKNTTVLTDDKGVPKNDGLKPDQLGDTSGGKIYQPMAPPRSGTAVERTSGMSGNMGGQEVMAEHPLATHGDGNVPTEIIADGGNAAQTFMKFNLTAAQAEMLAKAYTPASTDAGKPVAPALTSVVPQIVAIVGERTKDPAGAQEVVGRMLKSVQNEKIETLAPGDLGPWLRLVEMDVVIRKKYKEGDSGAPGKKEEYERLVQERQNYMSDSMGVIKGHRPYMSDDPISATLPAKQRTDHDNAIIRGNPNSPAGYQMRSQTNMALGNNKAALNDATKAAALDPKSAASLLTLGAAQERNGDYAGAAASARKALELDPSDKGALGLLHSVEGRGGATTAGAPAGAGSAGSAGAYSNTGASGFATGGFGSAGARGVAGMTDAASLASAQKLDEARRAMSLGDRQAAEALAQRALEINGGNYAAHGFLSNLYAYRGEYQKAIASASAGLALAPRDAGLLNSKAFAQNRSKLYSEALASSNGAIEADSRNPYSYANRAHAYGGLGDKDAMMSDITRAASMDPRFQKAAADAAQLQLPSSSDVLFLFPEEAAAQAAAPAATAPARSKRFGLVVGAGVLGGLLVALGLLSTVLSPIKDSVVSAFTKATRVGPSVHSLEETSAPEAAPVEAAGGVVRGQYEIVRQIGAGGMGMVYEGTDRSLGRRVAIKKMRDELRLNPRERERFVIEAKTVASLHHANIVDIYAIAEEGEDVYLVFEYVEGKTIHDLVQAKGRLSPADSARVTRAMGEALTYAHSKGVIHRDVKPSNVMLTPSGQIKVMDFGIARMAKDALTRYSMTQNVVGTPPYMAPEQEQGVVRKESDVYSLAICSYEMLTGKLPFIGMGAGMLMNKINMSYVPPSRAIAGLPGALDEVFLKAFQANPDQRYHTPQEFALALETAIGGVQGRI